MKLTPLRRLYHALVPLPTRLQLRDLRMRFLISPTTSPQLPPPPVSEPNPCTANHTVSSSARLAAELAETLRPIVQSRTLHVYEDVWHSHGFRLALNVDSFDRETMPLPFDDGSEWQRVRDYPVHPPAAHQGAAKHAAGLLKELSARGQVDLCYDDFAEAGFHAWPLNVPPPPAGFLPNLFILGAAKCATTTLHAYLDRMDGVCMSNPKEPFYLEAEYELGLAHFHKRYFRHWQGEPVIGEARQRNLYLPYVPERLYALNPEAKLIVMLRHPVDRAYSHWWHRYSRGYEGLSFEQAVTADLDRIARGYRYATEHERRVHQITLDQVGTGIYRTYIDGGYYDEQIARYLALFDRSQIHWILSEDLRASPFEMVRRVEAFIGTDFYREDNFPRLRENESFAGLPGKQHQPIRPEFRAWLTAHFRPHVERTAELIGRDLSVWM